jgi:hypothetical protein
MDQKCLSKNKLGLSVPLIEPLGDEIGQFAKRRILFSKIWCSKIQFGNILSF